jgi:hypothetical protein
VLTGNRIYDTKVALAYHDYCSTKDQLVRENYCHDAYFGVYQAMGNQSLPKGGSVLAYDAANSRGIFTSHEPHGLNTNDTVTISDAVVAPVYPNTDWLSNPFNRSGVSIAKINDYQFSYPLLSAPENEANAISAFVYRKNEDGFTWKPGSSLIRDPQNNMGAIFKAQAAHGLQQNQQVQIAGAFVWNATLSKYEATFFNFFNHTLGYFTVTAVPNGPNDPKDAQGNPLSFKYTMENAPPADPRPSPAFYKGTDPKKCGSVILRDGNTVSFTTVLPHGFDKRQAVRITAARINDTLTNSYNDFFEVTAIPTSTSFNYAITNPPTPVTAGGTAAFGALWQVRQLTVEDNVIRVAKRTGDYHVQCWGIAASDSTDIANRTAPYIFRQALVRGNWISQAESDADSIQTVLVNTEAGFLDRNLVAMNHPNPIYDQNAASVGYFNNLRTSGALVRGLNKSNLSYRDEAATLIEDAEVMSMFK